MSQNYLIEFRRIGALVKVTALDPVTGIEATIQGPVTAGEAILSQSAARKLEYLIHKAAAQKDSQA